MTSKSIFSIGHSTRSTNDFLGLLNQAGIKLLADVRTLPRSRHTPQFNQDRLEIDLTADGIEYRHFPALGGLRKPRADSPNLGWDNLGFRGYADYMLTSEFSAALSQLEKLGASQPLALMCAEALPWRCHRNLLSDALTVRGWKVTHLGLGRPQTHRLTKFAKADGEVITYPPTDGQTQLLLV